MGTGPNALDVLGERECLDLLASGEVGRVGVVVDGQPLVLSGELRARRLRRVARSGWSVLVQGMANDVTDALDCASEHLQTVELPPWAPGPKPRLLRISAATVTGRRFRGATPAA